MGGPEGPHTWLVAASWLSAEILFPFRRSRVFAVSATGCSASRLSVFGFHRSLTSRTGRAPHPCLTRFVWTRRETGLGEGWWVSSSDATYLRLLFPGALHAQLVHARVNWVRCQEIEFRDVKRRRLAAGILTGRRVSSC